MFRSTLLSLALTFAFAACATHHDIPQEVWTAEKPVYMFEIGGMWMSEDSEAVQNAVRQIEGVQHASAGWSTAKMSVIMERGYDITREQVQQALDNVELEGKHYTVRGMRPFDGTEIDDDPVPNN